MILDKDRNPWDLIRNFSNFFIDESCGLCTPCRAGNYLVGEKLSKINVGKGTKDDIKEIKKWAEIIKNTSRCGLGKTSNNYLLDAIEKFPEAFKVASSKKVDKHMREFSLEESLIDYADFVMKTNNHG